jgi:hypothetical protein
VRYRYKADYHPNNQGKGVWLSSQCMPIEAIRFWATVIDVQVKQVQDLNCGYCWKYDFVGLCSLIPPDAKMECGWIKHWFNHRHPGSWERNDWCEILTLKKEK